MKDLNNKQSNIYLQNAITQIIEFYSILEFLCTDNNLSKTELNIQLIEM